MLHSTSLLQKTRFKPHSEKTGQKLGRLNCRKREVKSAQLRSTKDIESSWACLRIAFSTLSDTAAVHPNTDNMLSAAAGQIIPVSFAILHDSLSHQECSIGRIFPAHIRIRVIGLSNSRIIFISWTAMRVELFISKIACSVMFDYICTYLLSNCNIILYKISISFFVRYFWLNHGCCSKDYTCRSCPRQNAFSKTKLISRRHTYCHSWSTILCRYMYITYV